MKVFSSIERRAEVLEDGIQYAFKRIV